VSVAEVSRRPRSVTADLARPARSQWVTIWRDLIRRRVALFGIIFVSVVYLLGILAPVLPIASYTDQNLNPAEVGQLPSLAHPLGTDMLGRDMLSRMIWGARTALIISVLAVTLGTTIGVVLGSIGGYFGGWIDNLIQRAGEIVNAFPTFLFLILIAATVKPRLKEIVLGFESSTGIHGIVDSGFVDYLAVFGILSLIGWAGVSRYVRGQILRERERDYLIAARSLGLADRRVIFRHLLPNALTPVVILVSTGLGGAVAAEVGLSFLGLGVQPPTPSWGTMINDMIDMWRVYPHLMFIPAAIIGTLVFSFAMIGDTLVEVLNPATRH
jgi:ABC-type dipeptide/oligopeptide/nickel transport system permease subunit